MAASTLIEQNQGRVGDRSTSELCDLAATGLVAMLDPEEQIFCDIYNRTEKGMIRERLSQRYTMMTLLGLHRYELSGRRSPVTIAPVLDALLRDTGWIRRAGDLGLLLWTCAELVPGRLPEVYEAVGAQGALARFSDGLEGRTMEVAWYLTGIAGCYLAGHSDLPGLSEQARTASQILEGNCGNSGVYGHLSRSRSLAGYLRGRIGSFADQVYPTIAFARLSQALQDDKARRMALRTAEKMCELQAHLGEWCWHYDSVSGKVVSRYPVYSVHQHAMGPMMLFAASEATGCDFTDAIYKGLAWIGGNNELKQDFVERSLGLVWRSIYLDPLDAYTDAALRFLQLRNGTADSRRLKVRYECRPYELGWLLYAFAGSGSRRTVERTEI
jgi:hypothetical protein